MPKASRLGVAHLDFVLTRANPRPKVRAIRVGFCSRFFRPWSSPFVLLTFLYIRRDKGTIGVFEAVEERAP